MKEFTFTGYGSVERQRQDELRREARNRILEEQKDINKEYDLLMAESDQRLKEMMEAY
ncbi:MAG: hypothetical protein ACTSYA_01790 [Candidatus Kariarchaeaceae archaeon]